MHIVCITSFRSLQMQRQLRVPLLDEKMQAAIAKREEIEARPLPVGPNGER